MDMGKILNIVYDAVDEINDDLPPEKRIEKSESTELFGESGKLNSLAFVRLIIVTEEKVQEKLGVDITLADKKALSQKNSPFRTIKSLTEYISNLLKNG